MARRTAVAALCALAAAGTAAPPAPSAEPGDAPRAHARERAAGAGARPPRRRVRSRVDTTQLVPAGDWRLAVTSRGSAFDEYAASLTVPVR
jgi:hypothetical protein